MSHGRRRTEQGDGAGHTPGDGVERPVVINEGQVTSFEFELHLHFLAAGATVRQ